MASIVHICVVALGALIPIVNPVGALAAFAGLTSSYDPASVKRQAVRTAIYVAAILVVFTLLGSLTLEAFGINLQAVQVAGGLVVAHSGFSMLSSKPSLSEDEHSHAASLVDISFSPMALPLIAGPGAIGVVIALAARHPAMTDKLAICMACVIIALIIGVLLRVATPWVDRLGPSGVGAVTRVMGFFILCIGVELVIHGCMPLFHR